MTLKHVCICYVNKLTKMSFLKGCSVSKRFAKIYIKQK